MDPALANTIGLVGRGTHGTAMRSTSGWYFGRNGTNTLAFNAVPAPPPNLSTLRWGNAIWTSTASQLNESYVRTFTIWEHGVRRGETNTYF